MNIFCSIFLFSFWAELKCWGAWGGILVPHIAVSTCDLWNNAWKSLKKSHSTLRAKRATFTFSVDKSWLKLSKMVFENLKLEVKKCYQTCKFWLDNNWWKMPKSKFKYDILGDFKTLCYGSMSKLSSFHCVFTRKTTNDHGHNFLAFGRQSSSSDRESFVPYVFFLSFEALQASKSHKTRCHMFSVLTLFPPPTSFSFLWLLCWGSKIVPCSKLKVL